jgi:hypothetical protein
MFGLIFENHFLKSATAFSLFLHFDFVCLFCLMFRESSFSQVCAPKCKLFQLKFIIIIVIIIIL